MFDAATELKFSIQSGTAKYVGNGLGSMIYPIAWWWCGYFAGQDLNVLTPEKVLHKQGDKRMIAMVHGPDDVRVPISQQKERMAFLNQTQFDIVATWYPKTVPSAGTNATTAEDDKRCTPHCETHASKPEEYQAFLCAFYSKVFGTKESACGLKKGKDMTVEEFEDAEKNVLEGEIFA